MPALEPGDHPLVTALERSLPTVPVLVAELHLPAARPVEKNLSVVLTELLPGSRDVETERIGDRFEKTVEVHAPRARPRDDRSVGDAARSVGHHELGVHLVSRTEPVTRRTRSVGRVEREVAGRGLVEREAAVRAGEMLREGDGFLFAALAHDADLGDSVCKAQRRLHRFGQPLSDAVAADQAVHDHLDRVLLVSAEIESRSFRQLHGFSVDPHPGEALLGQVLEQSLVLPLAAPDYGCENTESRSFGKIEHPVDDLLGSLSLDRTAAIGAMGPPYAGVEKSQVVVDLGDRADRRPRVAACRLLVDGDRRRKSFDEIDVGLVHLPEELPRVRRERLDVTALSFCVDRVERE